MCAFFHECQDGPWLQQIKSVSRTVAFQPLQILEVENFRSPSSNWNRKMFLLTQLCNSLCRDWADFKGRIEMRPKYELHLQFVIHPGFRNSQGEFS